MSTETKMLTFLLLLSALGLSSSTPISLPSTESNRAPLILFGRELPDAVRYRTAQDIIWSCLATMFACTWVSIHPNLPGPRDSGWTNFKRKAATMVFAMLVPEIVTLWAMQQWIAARRIVEEFNRRDKETSSRCQVLTNHKKCHSPMRVKEVSWYLVVPNILKECCIYVWVRVDKWFRDPSEEASNEWTLTHGFFVQMGGFILYDGEVPLRVLRFSDLNDLIAKNEVDTPRTPEDEINDKSKGDFLTKLFVVLQTAWFLFQCLARWAFHLPITELEVVTLAFAALNLITYVLWWKKPQGITVAIRVQLKSNPGSESGVSRSEGILEKETFLACKVKAAMNRGWFGWLFGVPTALLHAVLHPFVKPIAEDRCTINPHSLRVPMLYADETGDKELYPIFGIVLFLGSLHFIPWSSSFPSTTEHRLWQCSALIMVSEPVLPFLSILANDLHKCFDDRFSRALGGALVILFSLGSPLYLFARLTLLALAFSTLRALPPGAYKAIEWTTFFPHI